MNDVVEINECEVDNGYCSPFAICTKTYHSYDCTCMTGYTGDGFKCKGK